MPTEHAAKIRIYTFLSDVEPEGQVKSACPFSIGTIPQKYGGIVPNIVPHIVPRIVPIELQKPLFCAAVGKEKDGTFFTSTEKYLTKSCNKYRK